jgi:hypothetical protein
MLPKVEAFVPRLMLSSRSVIMPRTVLNERSAEYFRETRTKRFSMSLDELEAMEEGGERVLCQMPRDIYGCGS